MNRQYDSCIPSNSFNNDTDVPAYYLPIISYEWVPTTHASDIMPVLGDSIDYLVPGQPVSTYNYTSVSDMQQTQQGSASMQQVVSFDNRTITPFQGNGSPQQALISDPGITHDMCSFHGEGWMQFDCSTIDSKPENVLRNENGDKGLEIGDEVLSDLAISTSTKKCQWKGCTFPRPFRRDAELMRHTRTIHVSRDAYKCPICGRGFGRKDKMEDHRRTHTYNHAEARC